jgi:hypothetical protein
MRPHTMQTQLRMMISTKVRKDNKLDDKLCTRCQPLIRKEQDKSLKDEHYSQSTIPGAI